MFRQDAIDRVKTLQSEGRLSGVMDDRGKFICIAADEYEAVARFIRQRGRVSIAELADSVNRLIRLNVVDQQLQLCADQVTSSDSSPAITAATA